MLSFQDKSIIIYLYEQNFSIRKISKELEKPYTTIRDFIVKYKCTNSLERKIGSGRPKLLSSKQKQNLVNLKEKNNLLSSTKLKEILKKEANLNLSASTIRNYLKELGYYAGKLVSKPLLTEKHKNKRFEICKEWSFSASEFWNNVIFSDETKINLFNSDGQFFVWKKQGEQLHEKNIRKTKKFGGGGVLFWGCFSRKGVGRLVVIEGIMDKIEYVKILRENLFQSASKMNLRSFKFVQDNDPKHNAQYTRDYIDQNDIETLEWPSQSPDLNPIENLWAFIKNKLKGKDFKKKDDLIAEVMNIWNSITVEFCENLVDSMSSRICEVLRHNGGYTSY